ncbi:MAG: hypothetical protein K0S47_4097 [Herbinix sp.]|jgi:hypothetical protein|nr:hypothetical protein [Herbinix sp.]
MGQLILVEGIPGSGKTTLTKKLAEYLATQGTVRYYQEGDSHPADLGWCACIPEQDYEKIITDYPLYEARLREHGYLEEGYRIIPYTTFPVEDEDFYRLMESYEVYDNRVDITTFIRLHRKKWMRFGEEAARSNDYVIFECAYLQNHINELLLFHCMKEEAIREHLLDLITTVRNLNPVLIYLRQPNTKETIGRVSASRVDDHGVKVWMNRVIPYIEQSPYGKEHSLQGFDGMVAYFDSRKKVELAMLEVLPIQSYCIDNPDYEWDRVWGELKGIIDNNLKNKS